MPRGQVRACTGLDNLAFTISCLAAPLMPRRASRARRGRCSHARTMLARGAVRVCACLSRRGVTLRSRDCTFALSESSYGRLSAKVRAARREAAEACALGSALSGCAVMAPGFGFAPHHTSARFCSACAREDQEAPSVRRRTRRQPEQEASPAIKLFVIRLQIGRACKSRSVAGSCTPPRSTVPSGTCLRLSLCLQRDLQLPSCPARA